MHSHFSKKSVLFVNLRFNIKIGTFNITFLLLIIYKQLICEYVQT